MDEREPQAKSARTAGTVLVAFAAEFKQMIHGKGGGGTALLDFQADGQALLAQALVPLFGGSFMLVITDVEVPAAVVRLKFDDGGRAWVRFLADVSGVLGLLPSKVGRTVNLGVLA